MEMAFAFSARLGLSSPEDAARVKAHFNALALTTTDDAAHLLRAPETFLSHMQHDKKNEGGALTLILTRAIGEAFVQKGASTQDVLAYLQDLKEALG